MEVFIMPRISTFMYSEGSGHEALPSGEQRLHVVQPLHIFTPIFVPGTFSFSVVFGILDIDTDKDYNLRFTFESPVKTEELLIDTGLIHLPRTNDPKVMDLPKDMRGIMMNLGFQNVIFRNDGTYTSKVYFDNQILGEFPIKVKGRERLK
jgi:hypothetical protein